MSGKILTISDAITVEERVHRCEIFGGDVYI